MKIPICWSVFCFIFFLSNFHEVQANSTGIDGDITASSLTVTGPVAMTSITVVNTLTISSGTAINFTITNSTITNLTATLASGYFLVGNGSNIAAAVSPTGDANFTTAGVFNVLKVQGTSTNDNAPPGYVGQYVSSAFPFGVGFTTSGQFGNLTSVSLTPGDWDVSCDGYINHISTTLTGNDVMALSAYSGNTTTDHVNGDNVIYLNSPAAAGFPTTPFAIVNWRVSISTTTTIFMKGMSNYAGTAPICSGRISARRVR